MSEFVPPVLTDLIDLIDLIDLTDNNIKDAVNEWIHNRDRAETKYGHISEWDTSNITDMSKLFEDKISFNDNISGWDVSKVITMYGMFQGAQAFNQPINTQKININAHNVDTSVAVMDDETDDSSYDYDESPYFSSSEGEENTPPVGGGRSINGGATEYTAWDVSNVNDISFMFHNAQSFNQPIDKWDVSNVVDIWGVFWGALNFNQPIRDWDVSKVTNMEMMFTNAIAFNQTIGDWDVSKVTNMKGMFHGTHTFNQEIGSWDVSNVINMEMMFYGADVFNKPIGDWDVSKVTDMKMMFKNAHTFKKPIGNWNVSNVTDMMEMFGSALAFNQPIGNWDVSNVTDMSLMFNGAHIFNQPIGSWDVSKVTDMKYMFGDARVFNQPIGSWDVSKVTNMEFMFFNARVFNQPIGDWDVSKVTNMEMMFGRAIAFNQDISEWDVSNVINIDRNHMFDGTIFENNSPFFPMHVFDEMRLANYEQCDGVAFQVHNRFGKINRQLYINTIATYVTDINTDTDTPFFKDGYLLPIFTQTQKRTIIITSVKVSRKVFNNYIKNLSTTEKELEKIKFNLVTNKFKSVPYDNEITAIILVTFAYVWSSDWNDEARGEYVYSWIKDNVEAYTTGERIENNLSCLQGIIDRIVLSLLTILSKDDLTPIQIQIKNIILNKLPDIAEIFQLWVTDDSGPIGEIITKAKTGEIDQEDKEKLQTSFTNFAKEIYTRYNKTEEELLNDDIFKDYINGIDEYIGYMQGGWRHHLIGKSKRKTIKKRKSKKSVNKKSNKKKKQTKRKTKKSHKK